MLCVIIVFLVRSTTTRMCYMPNHVLDASTVLFVVRKKNPIQTKTGSFIFSVKMYRPIILIINPTY